MKISLTNVSKSYNSRKPRGKFLGGLFGIEEKVYALKDISFDINQGESVGIIGSNGSGKSTLLKLICKITSATDGEILTEGRISALLELGAGFNPEYTGISNIYLNGALYGLSKSEIRAKIPEITEFADIGDYIKKPVKTYSDGMFLRLAFACAVAVSPDILVVDEALAVGDFAFRQKCFSKIKSMQESGTTIIMVSHDIDTIRRFCKRVLWIENGTLKMDGDVLSVSSAYMEYMTGCAGVPSECFEDNLGCTNRFGSKIGAIQAISAPALIKTGSTCEVVCNIDIPRTTSLDGLSLSLSIKNSFGLDMVVLSTSDKGLVFKNYGRTAVKFRFECPLCSGEYSLCAALEDRREKPIKYYDYAEGAIAFKIVSDTDYFGVVHPYAEITIDGGN